METKGLKQTLAIAALLGMDGMFDREQRRPPKPHRTKSKSHRNRTEYGQKRRKLNRISKQSRARNRA